MTMKKTLWVVYEIGAAEKDQGMNVVCEQDEWEPPSALAHCSAAPLGNPSPLSLPACQASTREVSSFSKAAGSTGLVMW